MPKIKKLKLNIDGMHCGSCAAGIQMVLQNTDGVISASADWEKKNGEVEFDEEKVKQETLLKAIADLGYKATPVSAFIFLAHTGETVEQHQEGTQTNEMMEGEEMMTQGEEMMQETGIGIAHEEDAVIINPFWAGAGLGVVIIGGILIWYFLLRNKVKM